MIDHNRYRTLMLADPRLPTEDERELAQLLEHRRSCAECTQFTDRLMRFESRLERALAVNIPDSSPKGLPTDLPRASSSTAKVFTRWLALAASVLLAAVAVTGIWLGNPGRSLAADVVAHMAGEPDAWRRTNEPVSDPALAAVLRESRVSLLPAAGTVSYASSCLFRGHQVPHLVVQSSSGPVTVMVLVHESVRKEMRFDEQGYRGTIVPVAGHGSLAVLMRDAGTTPHEVADVVARVRDSIIWTR